MDNIDLYQMIFKRKSFHLFRNIGNDKISNDELETIKEYFKQTIPLDSSIKVDMKIVPGEKSTCKRGEEYCIYLYSENKDNYLANIGYIGEQLDLKLVSMNIGTLWYGIGKDDKTRKDNLDFIIMIAISKVNDLTKYRKDMFKAKRKPLTETWIGNEIEGVSNIVGYSPSSCNTQPWITKHIDDELQIYRYKKPGKRGIMPADRVTFYNRIDIGIYLCILELTLSYNHILFNRTLFIDNKDQEEVLVAKYKIKE
ncbi:MAG: nitroreductase family protein [Thomasclavelia sp.]|nr:nitroreductase family protein [Thomasclavelia sp.]